MNLNQKVFKENLSSRRFFVLVKGLPAESNFIHFISQKEKYNLATYNVNNLSI